MSATDTFDIADVRTRFTSLSRGFAFFDGPGGSQTPDAVGAAIATTTRDSSANLGAPYATSQRVTAILEEAERGAAAFVGCTPGEITFGMNMTSLNFALSRTAARTWQQGDRVIVSALDHDANVAPWIELAHDHQLDLQTIAVNADTTLDLDDLRAKLNDRTRVVAFTAASNAVGTKTPVREISDLAHAVGALSWVDGVHYAAHEPVDVDALGADALLCSTYKFCGPHLGFAYVRAAVAQTWRPYKVRPLPTPTTGRKMSTGTFPFEALAGLNATFAYIREIGGMEAIAAYEHALAERFLATLPSTIVNYGLPGLEGRLPTFVMNVEGVPADVASQRLAERNVGVWSSDTWYSLGLYKTLDFGERSLRIGMSHYNTAEEVDLLVAELGRLS
jgi:cysteine desulfurase family protein (TIGR01976 family)